ncbi:hypothetical protein JCM10296v2_001630 [Rhodotorula toruloides]
MVPALPIEIWEQIITHETRRKADLARCCLVNRQIGTLARAKLYRNVVIQYTRDFFYGSSPTPRQRLVHTLHHAHTLQHGDSAGPLLPTFLVRKLRINWTSPLLGNVEESCRWEPGEGVLSALLSRCPNVRSLEMQYCSPSLLEALAARGDALVLEHFEVNWSEENWLLLRQQPRLKTLTLWFGNLGWTTTPCPNEIGSAPFHLDTLQLVGRSVAIPQTHFRLLTQASTSSPRFLRVTIPAYEPDDDEDNDPDSSGFVWDFSQLAGLSHLWVDYEYPFLDLRYLRTVTSCPTISRLTLDMYGDEYYDESAGGELGRVVYHLAVLALPPRLERLDLSPLGTWQPLINENTPFTLTGCPSLRTLGYAVRQGGGFFGPGGDAKVAKHFLDWCSEHAYSTVQLDDRYDYL